MLNKSPQLELYDMPIEETDSLTDPELLMDILDAREELEEAQTEEDMEKVRSINAGTSFISLPMFRPTRI
jgi:hypothetical protein